MVTETEKEKLQRRLAKFIAERDSYEAMAKAFGQSPSGTDKLYAPLTEAYVEQHNAVIRAAENGEPFVASYYGCQPEIYVAMDLPWYTFLTPVFTNAMDPNLGNEIDATESMFGKDFCTAFRVAGYWVEKDLAPIPTAMIAMLHPCDASLAAHQLIATNEIWRHVPMFGCDPPYWDDDRSLDYYANETRQMISFLEEHTGRKLDMDRLREVCEESNKMYELWMEYNELRRAVPCPHGFGVGLQAFGVAENILVGSPKGTQWFRDLVADAEMLVKEGKGKVEDERVRIFWFDVVSLGLSLDLFPWLEQEYGAVVVMDMFGYTPYTLIDTTSEETMLKGLGKRALCDAPMMRQARGVADNWIGDIRHVVKDYNINCVVWPGHMGHKDGSANIGMMREECRDLGVPFIQIGMDNFDERYTTTAEIKDMFSRFFNAHGLG